MLKKFKHKPLEIEAVQLVDVSKRGIKKINELGFECDMDSTGFIGYSANYSRRYARQGDWLVRDWTGKVFALDQKALDERFDPE